MTTANVENDTTSTPSEAPWEEAHQSKPEAKGTARRAIDQSSKKIKQAKDTIAKSAGELKEKTEKYYHDSSEAAKRGYQKFSHQAEETYSKSKERVKTSFHDHPLAFTAGSFAIGLALGLAIPQLRKERKLLSRSGRKIRDAAENTAERAKEAASAAKDTASESLEEKGLDPKSVKESLKEVGEESIQSAQESIRK